MVISAGSLAAACGLAALASIAGMELIGRRVEPPGRVHVLYWEKWTGTEYAGIKAAVDGFNRSQDRIFVDLLSESDIGNKTMFAASAGMPPDVAGLWGENVPQYADERAVEPLDQYCAEFLLVFGQNRFADGDRFEHGVAYGYVLASPTDEGARLHGALDHHGRPIVLGPYLLEHAHGVGTVQQRRTRHDAGRLPWPDGRIERGAGHDGAQHREERSPHA